jgi:hypothetical protein
LQRVVIRVVVEQQAQVVTVEQVGQLHNKTNAVVVVVVQVVLLGLVQQVELVQVHLRRVQVVTAMATALL